MLNFLTLDTHEDIDGVFSKVSVFLYKAAIETVSVLLRILGLILKKFRDRPPYREKLTNLPDTWQWLHGCYNPIKGISNARSVRIAMRGEWAHIWSKATMAESHENYAPAGGVQLITAIPKTRPRYVVLKPLRLDNIQAIMDKEALRLASEDDKFKTEWQALYDAEAAWQKAQCSECQRIRILDRDGGKRSNNNPDDNKRMEAQRRKAKKDLEKHLNSGNCVDNSSDRADSGVSDWFFDDCEAALVQCGNMDAKHSDAHSSTDHKVMFAIIIIIIIMNIIIFFFFCLLLYCIIIIVVNNICFSLFH